MIDFSIVLFQGFETLDAMGPAEVIGRMPGAYRLDFYSAQGGPVTSQQGVAVQTHAWSALPRGAVLLVPGGLGTRTLVDDADYIEVLTGLVNASELVLTVCTGSALLARTGLLDGLKATGNKRAFDWNTAQGPGVLWQRKARWVQDRKYWTSSGISAGIDMALAFVAARHGREAALQCAHEMEYRWHEDAWDDPFARETYHG